MAKKIISKGTLHAIADSLRSATGSTAEMNVAQMVDAVGNVQPITSDLTEVVDSIFLGTATEVIVPRECTVIRDNAFLNSKNLKSVFMHSEITKVGSGAFKFCSNLELTSLPVHITEIGDEAFAGCTSIALTSLPPGLTLIDVRAFSSCKSLVSISIPSNVIELDSSAFSSCSNLREVTFEGTPTRIAYTSGVVIGDVFGQCTNLTTINVPWAEGAVKGAPWGATNATINYNYHNHKRGCSVSDPQAINEDSLTALAAAIRTKTGSTQLMAPKQMPADIRTIQFVNNDTRVSLSSFLDGSMTEFVVPESATSIPYFALENFDGLVSITIPESVTSIGDYALQSCNSLAAISLPSGLISIGNYAFNYSHNVSLSSIPASVESIGRGAFRACDGITEITFEGTPISIESDVFSLCDNLTTINVPWAEGAVANAPWGATNATINYNYTEE